MSKITLSAYDINLNITLFDKYEFFFIYLEIHHKNQFATWDQRFLWRILPLSFKWQIILVFPGRTQVNLPP